MSIKAVTRAPAGVQQLSHNEHFFERVRTVVRAAAALDAEGHRILSADLGLGAIKPTIQVANDPRLGAKVAAEQAAYYRFCVSSGLGGRVQERTGQFDREGCRVVWTERGH